MLKLSRRHGTKFFYARGTYLGVSLDRSTGVSDRKEAEVLLAKIQKQIFNRESGRAAGPSFAEAALTYMKAGGERRFLEPVLRHFGDTPVDAIDQNAVTRAALILYPEATPSTRNRQVITVVSAVLKMAGISRKFHRPKPPPENVRWLTQEEAGRLIEACSPHLRPLVIFLLYTGARAGEALWLDWRNVDLGRAHVSFPKTKNGTARGVPLHPNLIAALASLKHRDGEVFRRPDGEPYERPRGDDDRSAGSKIGTAFGGALKRAGIKDFRVHDCRHTWASWHYREHRDLIALQRLGGWKTLSMVTRYAHQNSETDRDSINALPSL